MKVGKITKISQEPEPSVKPDPGKDPPSPITVVKKLFSVDMGCSAGSELNQITRFYGPIEHNVLSIKIKRVPEPNEETPGAESKPLGDVSLSGDTGCLHCSSELFMYCNGCEHWYCEATKEVMKDSSIFGTCPVHGRMQISGTANINPTQSDKKK